MKKIIICSMLMFLALPCASKQLEGLIKEKDAKPIECEITFDWISKTQFQRDEIIKQIQNVLVNEQKTLKFSKNEFRTKYAEVFKDKDYMQHYNDISSGKKEDDEKFYAGFFLKNGLLIAYGIQYKNNMKNIYYYDVMGNLRFIDIYSDSYPEFPYYALQYGTNGKLIGTIYFVSHEDQYVFNPDNTFRGRWFKEKMYNKNAKVIMTRSNY